MMVKTKVSFLITLFFISILASGLYAQEYGMTAETLYSFGQAYFKEHRYGQAETELKKCLMLNPEHAKAKLLMERCEDRIEIARKEAKADAMNRALKETDKNIKKQAQEGRTEVMPKKKESPEGDESLVPPTDKGAWTQKKGQFYTELYTKYFWHNHQFNNDREKKRWDFDGKGDAIRTELKLEYGLNDTNTLLLSAVAVEMHWKDSFRSSTRKGFTEVKPGIKHLLFTDPFICSVQEKVKLPLHYSEEAIPALDKHQIDAETRILTAQPWPKLPGYTKFEIGFKYRAEERSNEIPYFFEFGYNLFPSLILKTTLDGQTAVGGGTKEDLLKYTAGPIFKLKDLFNIEFSYGCTFAGRNTSAGKEIISSISRQW
ncbi:MAG: tetratricopeptide repeat protein [Candidatus Omnitrophota bacterium]